MNPFAPWRPILRLARRDARRHLTRTILATLLIALPIAGLVGFVGFSGSDAPSSERALASIPDGVQARLTATALPQGGPPFPQLPEGAPGPWFDDRETLPASAEQLTERLAPGARLLEHWLSPELIVSPELGLAPGEQHEAGEGAATLDSIALARISTVRLEEAVPEALPFIAPSAYDGKLPSTADEVLVTSALAERLSLEIGDELGFLAAPDTGWRSMEGNTAAAMQNSERGYRVVGIAEDARQRAWVQAGWLSALVDAHPGGIQRHWLVVGEAPLTWAEAKQLNELQAFAVSRHVLTNYPSPDELYPVAFDAGAVIENAVAVLIMTLLGVMLVLFLVTPAFAVSAEQSRRSLGLAAAAGASPRDLRRSVLAQGLVLGALGGAVGAILGFAAALGLTAWIEAATAVENRMTQSYSVSAMLAHFPWWVLPVGVLIALALGAFAALPPARRVAKLSPVDALRDRKLARAPRGRAAKLLFAIGGPALIFVAVAVGALTLLLPTPEYGDGMTVLSPGTLPPGGELLQALVFASVVLAAAGVALTLRAVVAWLGKLGRHSRPTWRLAMRDAADHPSRTVPAALGVVFAIAAASMLTVTTASLMSSYRDNSAEIVRGTLAIGAQVPVSADFDRLLIEGAVEAAADEFSAITGSGSVSSPSFESSLHFAPVLPEGVSCPPGQSVHVSSAVKLGAPLRCAAENSLAAFQGGLAFPSWLGSNTELMEPDTMRATGMPNAEQAAEALELGGAVIGNAALLNADSRVRLGVSSEFLPTEANADRVVTVPGAFVRGLGATTIVTPETARELGVDEIDYLGEVVTVSEPLSYGETLRVRDFLRERSSLLFVGLPDNPDPVGGLFYWAPILLLAFVAVAATAVAVLLSATQGRRDATTMHAVGADRPMLVRLGLTRAGVILALGVPMGLVAGIGLGAYQIAWNRHLEASGAWLSTVFVWDVQAWLALGVVAAGLVAALVFARPPRSFVRRSLD